MATGIIGLLILTLCILLFITEWLPAVVTGALGCLMMVLFQVCTLEEAFSGFSNSIIYLLFGALIIGNAMFETGAAVRIGHQAVIWSKDNERRFLLISGFAAGLLAMFLANTAVIAAFLPIIDGACSTSCRMKRKNLTLNLAICTMLGGSCTLIGCTPQLTANALLFETTGTSLSMFTMFAPGFLMLLFYLFFTQLFGYRLGERIWGGRLEERFLLDAPSATMEKPLSSPNDKKHRMILGIILAAMLFFYLTEWLSTAMTAMCAAMLCILTGCTNVKTIRNTMDWESVLFLAFCLGLANALNAGGSGELMTGFISSMLGNHPSDFLVYAALCLLTLAVSNFITNSTAILIVLPVGLSISTALGINPLTMCLGIYFSASLACSTPLAAAQISMTLVAGYRFTDYVKYTLPHTLLFYLCILFIVPAFFPF